MCGSQTRQSPSVYPVAKAVIDFSPADDRVPGETETEEEEEEKK